MFAAPKFNDMQRLCIAIRIPYLLCNMESTQNLLFKLETTA